MEYEPDTLNWYKISLMKIADEIGTPKAESFSEWKKLVRNSVGIHLNKESAAKIDRLIKNTSPNSAERTEEIKSILASMKMKDDDIKIVSSLLGPYV